MRTILLSIVLLACNNPQPGPTAQKATDEPSQLDKAHSDVTDARDRYIAVAKQRLAKLDAQIDDLAKRADSSSTAAALRARRDQLASKLDEMSRDPGATWERFKHDLDGAADSIEKDVERATK